MALSDIDKSPLYIDSTNSRVGIGTTSANKSSSSTALTVNTSSAGNYSALELSSGDTLNWYINSNNTAVYDVTAGTRPRIFYTNGAERMRIDSSGRVGIGTSSPSVALQVKGASIPIVSQSTSTGTGPNFLKFIDSASTDLGYVGYGASNNNLYLVNYSADPIIFYNSSEKMRIDSSGNVGIGTSSPAYNLDVYNSASTGAPLLARFKSAGGDTQLYVDNSTITTQLTADSFSNSGIVGTLTNHPFVFRTNNIERMRIHSNGDVSIVQGYLYFGAVSNQQQFVRGGGLSGTQLIVGSSSGGFYHQVGSNYYLVTTSGGSTSDETLKENVTPITSAVDKIKQLNGVYFNFIEEPQDEANKGLQIGIIAQNIEQQFPEIVVTDDDGIKSVRYEKLVAPLIEAVKEQQEIITALEARIVALETA